MKRLLSAVVVVVFLFGCRSNPDSFSDILSIRERLNSGATCKFRASVTLDYGDSLYSFAAECEADTENNMRLTVIEPASIAGVCGEISAQSGKIAYGDQILAFEQLAENQITPICVPWLLTKALRSGYINSSGTESVQIDDSYKNCEFSVEVYLNEIGIPTAAELLWSGKRIASVIINDFLIV